jgi:ATP-dependent RNA helicase RhlE
MPQHTDYMTQFKKNRSNNSSNSNKPNKPNNQNSTQKASKPDNRRPSQRPVRKRTTTMPIHLLVQDAVIEPLENKYVGQRYDASPIHSDLLKNLIAMGFTHTTEIQERTFEALKAKKDVIGIASTGTGKTGAFLIPMLDNNLQNREQRKTLIVVPTRELALQVQEECTKLAKGMRLQRGHLQLQNIETLILDEFDKMLDMGFVADIRKLKRGLTGCKQTLLFSATNNPKQRPIIDEFVTKPVLVEVSQGNTSSKRVQQDIIHVKSDQDKFTLLLELLQNPEYDKVILFIETKHLANRIAKKLNGSGVSADSIHGDKSQNYRVNALNKFKDGTIRVLVATDVAARGIDINDVALVVNYQIPNDHDTYIHRVGRTGRAGKTGQAFTFVETSDLANDEKRKPQRKR